MAEIPQMGDRLIHYLTMKLGSNSASISLRWEVTRNFPSQDLVTWVGQSFLWGSNLLSPLVGNGDYLLTSDLTLLRGGSEIDHAVISDIGMSVTGQGNPLPPNATALSSFKTADHKPRQVSRTYWPFIRSDWLGDSTKLTATGVAAYQAAATSTLGIIDWGGGGFALRVRRRIYHRSTGTDSVLAIADTRPEIATQRRRVRGSQRLTW